MIPPHTSTRPLHVRRAHRPRSFWLIALLGLPALNLAVTFFLASAGAPLVPVAAVLAVLALVELVLLIVLSPRYGVGTFGALAAMIGNAALTILVPIVLFYILLAINGCDECLS